MYLLVDILNDGRMVGEVNHRIQDGKKTMGVFKIDGKLSIYPGKLMLVCVMG